MKRLMAEIILISVLFLGIMLPFLGKPFHIDDGFYIEIAKAIVHDPFRPYSFMINWGEVPASSFGTYNPPLFSYFLAPVWAKWGSSEVPLHLVALLFAFSAVLSFYFLCREIGIKPLTPTLVFLSVPFLAVGTNLMIDTPALGLAIPSVLFFVVGVQREKLWPLILSGVLFSLAFLTKYSALALFAPFFIYPFLSKKPGHMIPFVIGFAVFLLWNIYCFYIYGRPHFMNTHVVGAQTIYYLLLSPFTFVMIIGMTLPYAILIIRPGLIFYFSLLFGTIASAIYLLVLNKELEYLLNGLLAGAGVFLGTYLLLYLASHLELKKKGSYFTVTNDGLFIFMVLWIVMIVIMNLFFTPFVAFRYAFFMYPALIIIMFKYSIFSKITGKTMYMVITCMIVVHLSLAYADFRHAQSYKNAAERFKKTYHDKTVWFLGHHGWHCYADAAGFKKWSKLDTRTLVRGDIVIIPRYGFKQAMTEDLKSKLKNTDSVRYELAWLPVRSHSDLSHAGFYASDIWRPPYIFSLKPLEVMDVYEVVR